jgi:tetratricopeptide (TPR) repeat protein
MTVGICLNMIVKNESAIIVRMLDTVFPHISTYCICDTGSSDDTMALIKDFFDLRNMAGILMQTKFVNFEHTRSIALNACCDIDMYLREKTVTDDSVEMAVRSYRHFLKTKAKTKTNTNTNTKTGIETGTPRVVEYVLCLDADMKMECHAPMAALLKEKKDVYLMQQGNCAFSYANVRLVSVAILDTCRYWGVTHEYLQYPSTCSRGTIDKAHAFIRDIGDGGCKADKFERDIRLLQGGLEKDPKNARYMFYLAKTYFETGRYADAIAHFEKNLKLDGWVEERWYSYYCLGKCHLAMNRGADAVQAWLGAYEIFPHRVENIYEIAKYYRCARHYDVAHMYYTLASEVTVASNLLFMENDVYDYKLDYEMTVVGYYSKHNKKNRYDLALLSMSVMYHGYEIDNVLSNYKFYAAAMQPQNSMLPSVVSSLQCIGQDVVSENCDFVASTPSFCRDPKDDTLLHVIVRFVNYKILDSGLYSQKKTIVSINVMAEVRMYADKTRPWTVIRERRVSYDRAHDNDLYIGSEDMRLFASGRDETIYYNANRVSYYDGCDVEHGTIADFCCQNSCLLEVGKDVRKKIEKNWVLFQDMLGAVKCVYEWSPLTVADIVGGNLENIVRRSDVPSFFSKLRGSTHGVAVGSDIWFLCHAVSYEDRRYYYHIVVVLSGFDYSVKSYTPFWTFEREKVEYSLGMIYRAQTDDFFIGYSVMDRETKYITIEKRTFDDMMICKREETWL